MPHKPASSDLFIMSTTNSTTGLRREFIENIDTANEEIERLDTQIANLTHENQQLKQRLGIAPDATEQQSASGQPAKKPAISSGVFGLARAIQANQRNSAR